MKNNRRLNIPKPVDSLSIIEQSSCLEREYTHIGVRRVGESYIDLEKGYVLSPKEIELRRTMFANDS